MVPAQRKADSARTILLIDDDESIRQVLSLALEFEGYQVSTASNGKEGLEILRRMPHRPFVILLDLMMPVLDGWGFMTALETMPGFSDIPIVIITAFLEKNNVPTNLEVIQKPIDLEYLFNVIKELKKLEVNQ